ncbi:toll-like receptor 3 [Spodoptera frugiperda]|uniref:Toll-like receptor 3 n=1 Tax=Spodoptera frugiperda TaxID=7108 RepID=A0A9R0D8G3_SPOFR|nr:toll-like receptor 3 [Spodoptera frugiperda]
MSIARYIWLLLCYAQYARSNLMDEYKDFTSTFLYPKDDKTEELPIQLGKDWASGCICRATYHQRVVVCFGNYECMKFPRVKVRSEVLRVRTTVITEIRKGELDFLYYLKVLEIEANHQLRYLQPGIFSNLTNLEQLSISYNTLLQTIHETTFEGLTNLHNLTLVNNGFNSVLQLTPSFKPSILPSLKRLDLSENTLETIPEDAFKPMAGTSLRKLDLNLCRLDHIHPNAFLPLKHLRDLHIGDNDLNSTLIENFLVTLIENNINLLHLDLSGMGFRKQPPKKLMNIIANSTIQSLILTRNQFEIISKDSFPKMPNLQLIDLRKVSCILVDPMAFTPEMFPNLRFLLLSGNNLPGIHGTHLSNQLMLLDLSDNRGHANNPVYYEIDRYTFTESKNLQVLNLAFNGIRAIFNYTFTGLENLKILSMENGTIYHIGADSFKATKHLEILNLANNPLTANQNLTSAKFDGLNELKILILENCGIKQFYDDDNFFEMMPNLTHLVLRNNQLYYITAEILKPLKFLQFLDLSENLLMSWWKPIFLSSGVKPNRLYLTNNKISHFSLSMIQDIGYLLEASKGDIVIDLMDNIFVCDCNSMFTTYRWLQANATKALKQYIFSSKFQCTSPDLWEDRRVSEYLISVKSLHCLMYEKISNVMVLVWTAPSLVTISLVLFIIAIVYKFRMYIRYWMFIAKVALGRNLKKKQVKTDGGKTYKYDAFVSYCNEDREFVHEMISQLESKPPFLKLCVYERDFEIGSFISEAVLTSINESKYVILIISNSFAKSQWCRWETQLAEYHRIFLEDGTTYDPLVLIRIGEIQSKYLTTTLKYLLKTKIYHSWDQRNEEEFWKKLRDVIIKK